MRTPGYRSGTFRTASSMTSLGLGQARYRRTARRDQIRILQRRPAHQHHLYPAPSDRQAYKRCYRLRKYRTGKHATPNWKIGQQQVGMVGYRMSCGMATTVILSITW